MAFSVKNWFNSPNTTTPISASALQDLETRVTNIGLGGCTSQTGATYTAVAGDIVLANPASGNIIITLPPVTQSITVTVIPGSNISSTNFVQVAPNTGFIHGVGLGSSVTSINLVNPGQTLQCVSDGSAWYVIGTVNGAGLSVGGGSTNIATPQSTSSASYTTLATADQVPGIVLPTNGLIRVWYQAIWLETVASAGHAAIFIGANQLKVQSGGTGLGPSVSEAVTNQPSVANVNSALTTGPWGLFSAQPSSSMGADVTTGQVAGGVSPSPSDMLSQVGGQTIGVFGVGGPCDIDNLPAGTYTISVQFKASSGSVTVSNRRLRAQVISFA